MPLSWVVTSVTLLLENADSIPKSGLPEGSFAFLDWGGCVDCNQSGTDSNFTDGPSQSFFLRATPDGVLVACE